MKDVFDILIIGAGPAGLSAAIEAAKYGAEVLVVDENSKPGGQLFKQIHKFFGSDDTKQGSEV
ncbi:MAG: FAD-dependent oxidoreductase [[Clostridium] scindens]